MMVKCSFLLATLFVNCLSYASLSDKFDEEYSAASAAFEKPFKESLTVRTRYWLRGAGRPIERTAFFYGEFLRLEVAIANREIVSCIGNRWSFTASRKKGDPDYSLERVDDLTEVDFMEGLDPELRGLRTVHCYHFCVYGMRLSDVIASSSFRILESEELFYEGAKCLKLKYAFDRQGYESIETVVLDPSLSWAIRSVESLTVPDGKAFSTKVSYNFGDVAFPSEVVVTLDGNPYLRTSYEGWSEEKLDPERFTLSYYGFPDYRENNPFWLWLGIGAMFCFACLSSWRRLFRSN